MFAPFDINNFDDIIYLRNTTQQEQSMHTPDPIRVVRIALTTHTWSLC
jgi:hypothetical protein